MSKGRDTIPSVPSGTETKMPARSAGKSRKIEIRSLSTSRMSRREVLDAAGAAAVVSALGTAERACWIVLCALPAAVPVAWLVAAAWPAAPPGLVVCWGGLNGASDVAEAEEAAYPYIAAESWAHISLYSASFAAIAWVLRPNRFVASSVVSRLRLTATTCGATVDVNAVW